MSYTPGGIELLIEAADRSDARRRIADMSDIRTAMYAEKGEYEKAVHTLKKVLRRG